MATLNVQEDYGAEGDGTTDDTQAIRNAINDLNDGDTLYFPEPDNSYLIANYNGQQVFNISANDGNNITMAGDGEGTIIQKDGGHTESCAHFLFSPDSGSFTWNIQDLEFHGDPDNNEESGYGPSIRIGGHSSNVAEINIDNCRVQDVSNIGINIRSGDCTITNTTVRNAGFHGFGIGTGDSDTSGGDVVIRNCYSVNNGKRHNNGYGVDWSDGDGLLENTVIEDCKQSTKISDTDVTEPYSVTFRRVRAIGTSDTNLAFIGTDEDDLYINATVTFEDCVYTNHGSMLYIGNTDENWTARVADNSTLVMNNMRNDANDSWRTGVRVSDGVTLDAPNATIAVNDTENGAGFAASGAGGGSELGTLKHDGNDGGATSGDGSVLINNTVAERQTDIEGVPNVGQVGAFVDGSGGDFPSGSTGSENTETQSVEGQIEKVNDDPKSAVFGKAAVGQLDSDTDVYTIQGRIEEFYIDEPVTIRVDGEEISGEEFIRRFVKCESVGDTSSTGTAAPASVGNFGSSGSNCEWTAPEGNQRYVTPGGGGDGSEANPWSVDQANANAAPGDVVNFKAGEYNETIDPENDGEDGNPIIFRSAERHGAIFRSQMGNIGDVSNIILEGFHVELEGDGGIWLSINRSDRIIVRENLMQNHQGNRNPVRLAGGAQNIRIEANFFRNTTKGDMITYDDCDNVILEGNDISRAGHAPFVSASGTNNAVVRGNVLHAVIGRNFGVFGESTWLIENNMVVNGFDGPGSAEATSKIGGNDEMIVRFNRFIDHYGCAVKTAHYLDSHTMHHARFYNNIFDNCEDAFNPANENSGYGGFSIFGYGQDQFEDTTLENNVFSRNHDSELYFYRVPDGAIEVNKNFFWNDEREALIRETKNKRSVSNMENAKPNRYSDNQEVNPGFADPNNADYFPASDSPMKNAGNIFTETSSNGSGATIPVEDTYYFYDGYGIPGETGDRIQVGDQTARITSVDHNSGEIQVDSSLNWSAGDSVSLPWSGDAPDIGAFETGNGRIAVRVAKNSFELSTGEELSLKAQLTGPAEIQEVKWYLGNGNAVCGDGTGIKVTYDEPYDYGIRARVVDADGNVHWGVDYVKVSSGSVDVTSIEYNKNETERILCSWPDYTGDGKPGGYHC